MPDGMKESLALSHDVAPQTLRGPKAPDCPEPAFRESPKMPPLGSLRTCALAAARRSLFEVLTYSDGPELCIQTASLAMTSSSVLEPCPRYVCKVLVLLPRSWLWSPDEVFPTPECSPGWNSESLT